jgi:hypothetical protein
MMFWLPTRPYNVIAAINRMAAATGSCQYAMSTANADYNGHSVSIDWNHYRGYWIARYTWAGTIVIARGRLVDCLRTGKAEYDRGALGAEVMVRYPKPSNVPGDHEPSETVEEFAKLCAEEGYTNENELSPEAHDATWRTPLHALVNDAMSYQRYGLAPAVGFLANSKTVEEYEAKLKAHFDERKAMRTRTT